MLYFKLLVVHFEDVLELGCSLMSPLLGAASTGRQMKREGKCISEESSTHSSAKSYD